MGDYIEREKAMEIVKRTIGDYAAAWSEIRQIPAADVAPVVHSEWIPCENGGYYCSRCDVRVAFRFDNIYCPHCGAKMDGERKEE
jgi:hypothetical protein